MNKSLVCRVLVPRTGERRPAVSTGYAIKKEMVMLSRHALLEEHRDENEPVILRWEDLKDKDGKVFEREINPDGAHFPKNGNHDLALVECETPYAAPESLGFLAPLSFPQGRVWETYGYPKSQQQDDETDYAATTVGGTTTSYNENGKIELDSTTEMKPPEEWAGISGAPIFFGQFLAGVIVEKPMPHAHRLEGISLAYLIQENPEFAELLSIPEEGDKYLNKALEILKDESVFACLKRRFADAGNDEKQMYGCLVSRPVGQFLEEIVELQKQNPAQRQSLSNLVFALLPHFIDPVAVRQGRQRIDAEILPVSHVKPQPIEAYMAKIDQRAIAIDVLTDDQFMATYALPAAPESGDSDEQKVHATTQDLYQTLGGDLLQIPLVQRQTNRLLKKTGIAGLPQGLTHEQKKALINQRLNQDRKSNKPRYYLVASNDEFEDDDLAKRYYEDFKRLYPNCAVIMPSGDFEQLLQDDEDYYHLCSAISLQLTEKDH